jgi:CrcB protein
VKVRATLRWRDVVAVAVGGMLGTGIRLAIDLLIPHEHGQFPLSTLLVNVTGSLLLGVAVSTLWGRVPVWARAGLGAGVLGAFTTFSAVMVSLVELGTAGNWMLAAAYLAASLVLGLGAAALGLQLGRASGADDWVDE